MEVDAFRPNLPGKPFVFLWAAENRDDNHLDWGEKVPGTACVSSMEDGQTLIVIEPVGTFAREVNWTLLDSNKCNF